MTTSAPMLVKLRFVHRDRDRHGNERIYFWRKRQPKIRIREQPGTPEFYDVYRALLQRSVVRGVQPTIDHRPTHGTYRWLGEQYMMSPDFHRLDARTQRVKRAILEATFIEPLAPGDDRQFGDMPISQMRAKAIRVLGSERRRCLKPRTIG